MSLIKGGMLDRRGFLKTSVAAAAASTLPMGKAFAANRGGHIRCGKAHGQTTDTMNPGTWENGFTIDMAFGIHGFLTEVGPDGSVVPNLAESWEASDDASEWRFKIRKGATFHSGKEMTVEDVVASINFHRGENSTSAAGPIVAPIVEITTEGDDTVVFKLDGGNADFPFILTDYHLPICKADGDSIDWQSGDGLGAYVMKSREFGVQVTLERNPNHWRDDVGFFDSIEMLALVDLNARTTALVSGDVDIIDRLDLKTVGLLARNSGVKIQSISGQAHYTIPMDTRIAPFNDNNVRQALKYACNREEMVEKILFGYGTVGNDHPIGSGQRFYHSELEQKTYDPEKAAWYIKQAGMDSLAIKLHSSDAAFGSAVDAAVLFQASARGAGIEMDVVREPNDGYWSDVWMKKGMVFSYWGGRPVEDQMFATAYKCGASWNESYWCNERFDELMIKARAELDDTKRREMYWEMQELVGGQRVNLHPRT
ncbi:MAG: ABC transporter substrate-binding protein, partial [Roseovarius sp.]